MVAISGIDFYAGQTHYADHLYPIWAALPEEARGLFVAAGGMQPHTSRHAVSKAWDWYIAQTERFDIDLQPSREAARERIADRDGLLVVAGYEDLAWVEPVGREHVFVEHGVGQWFEGITHPAWAGSRPRPRVRLFICPSERLADRNRETYPDIPAAAVGCPKLDIHHRQPPKRRKRPPVIYCSWHWDCRIVPEAGWAFPEFRRASLGLMELGHVIGGGHPRSMRRIERHWRTAGVPVVRDFADALWQADIMVNDASSTLWEFASLDRPVVLMNSKHYRRDVEHGLRFWEYADVGMQVDDPADLVDVVRAALRDPVEQQERRRRAIAHAYAHTDGRASQRAAAAIMEVA